MKNNIKFGKTWEMCFPEAQKFCMQRFNLNYTPNSVNFAQFMIRTFSTYRYSFGWIALCSYLFLLVITATHHHSYSFSTNNEIRLTNFVPTSDPYLDEFNFCKVIQTYKSQLNSKFLSNDFIGKISPENLTLEIIKFDTFECFCGLILSPRSPPLS
ncbi:MAG: hypothetical protein KKH32_07075 [Bacteroidetes bacterium]|nr:hypothetical protein [Bacteroidota bacterium]